MTTTAQGYGIEATLSADELHVLATTKPGRLALLGPDAGDRVAVPLRRIASAEHRKPKGLGFINGRLDVRTTDGKRYQMHYRAKKNRDFAAFADAVVAAVMPVQSA